MLSLSDFKLAQQFEEAFLVTIAKAFYFTKIFGFEEANRSLASDFRDQKYC